RPCLVFDQTNQYIAQVVNDSRQNKPSIKPLPVDSNADVKVAEILEGLIRHVEYSSRADIAYDTAIDYSTRIGLGGFYIVNKITNAALNEQEPVIKRIHDPLSLIIDPDSCEPDGSDQRWAAIESFLPKDEFERLWPKVEPMDFEPAKGGITPWFGDKTVRICDYWEVVENKKSKVVVAAPNGEETFSREEYDANTEASGFAPAILREYEETERTVKQYKLCGSQILEESVFPSCYIPVIPVIGCEIWIDGKRYLCGMVRRMMDAQRAYNYERTAYIEAVALQPSAPYIAAWEAIADHQEAWRSANVTKRAYLPYDHVDQNGNILPPPVRQEPPVLPTAFVQGGQMALADIQASIGMYRANLGAPSNETSGKAITARKVEGDTANYHYIDNLNRSIEQAGRVVVDMITRLFDSKRIARIIGSDGTNDFVQVQPDMDSPYVKAEDGRIFINPQIGRYDVRVVAGPSYTTMRQEAAAGLSQILQANPGLTPVIGPMWAQMQDWPDADKVAKALTAMAPPQVQDILKGEDGPPPEMRAFAAETKQHMDQMQAIIQQQQQQMAELQAKAAEAEENQQIEWYKAETDRLKSLQPAATAIDPQMIAAIVQQTMMQMLQMQPAQEQIPPEPQEYQPPAIPPTDQPPSGGVFMPEE
ncbi:MAG TPA: portal protein, partial [Terriglobales bacterium]|nr:portal protein [Terriglobales bacterium]